MPYIITENVLLITRLLNDTDEFLDPNIRVYVFGSFIRSTMPNDIDLLIVYGCPHTPASITVFRRKLSDFLGRELGLGVDTCCLSVIEVEHNNFIFEEGCIPLTPAIGT